MTLLQKKKKLYGLRTSGLRSPKAGSFHLRLPTPVQWPPSRLCELQTGTDAAGAWPVRGTAFLLVHTRFRTRNINQRLASVSPPIFAPLLSFLPPLHPTHISTGPSFLVRLLTLKTAFCNPLHNSRHVDAISNLTRQPLGGSANRTCGSGEQFSNEASWKRGGRGASWSVAAVTRICIAAIGTAVVVVNRREGIQNLLGHFDATSGGAPVTVPPGW